MKEPIVEWARFIILFIFLARREQGNQLLFRNSLIPSCGQAILISMTSTCCPLIADNYSCESISELGMQSSKPLASSDAQPLGFAACFNLSTVGEPALMDNH
jgi:hypothetical protein